jgi:hypothetical protein
MQLQVVEHHGEEGGQVQLAPATRVVYDVAANSAELAAGPVTIDRHSLSFELVANGSAGALLRAPLELDPDEDYLLRCDRVDFPPGGVAYSHVHQGPGIRVLLIGTIDISVDGTTTRYLPLQAWFERGPDPVIAHASPSAPTAFVRSMVLPRRLLGRSSIAYVRPEDAEKPKLQRYTHFVEAPVELSVRS